MKLTTKIIIQVLPFDQSFKDDLLQRFDSLSDNQQLDITNLVWSTYYALYQLKLEENLDLALEGALDGNVKFDKDLYKRVSEETQRQMTEEVNETADSEALSETRQKLQEILNKPSVDMSPAN